MLPGEGADMGCLDCAYSVAEDAERDTDVIVTCRRLPPQLYAVPVRNPITGQEGVSYRAMFTVVGDAMWCGEFVESAPGLLALN